MRDLLHEVKWKRDSEMEKVEAKVIIGGQTCQAAIGGLPLLLACVRDL